MSQIPIIQPHLVLGLQTKVKGNAQFITDEEIIYPVGGVLAVHNFNQRRQKFIKLSDKGLNVTSITVSPNRKLIAIAESGDRPLATLFDATTCKKKKQILVPPDRECTTREFASVAFTLDSKSIIVVTGEPDWTMYLFKCDKGKLENTTRANNSNGTGMIAQVACNPTDPNLLALVGNQCFRILACSDNNWRQYGFNKADTLNLTCAAWLSQDRLLAGTVDGKIMAFENGELKSIYFAGDLSQLNFKVSEDIQQGSQVNIAEPEYVELKPGEDCEIRSLFNFSKGFAFGFLKGTVHFFEKETPHKYRKRNVFKIPDHNIEREDFDNEEVDFVMNTVNCLNVNVSEDRLITTCNETQIYAVRLWGIDITVNPEIMFVELGMDLHHGPIGGLAVCAWKPIFLTSGSWDRCLKLWNFETDSLDLSKKYLEDLYGLALHPTGLFAIVGFSDKLRFLTILMDDFSMTREFPIRNCKLVTFSKLGHLFAAANGNVIQVYSSISFEHLFNLKGHNGRVTGMSWVHDDYKMASCGTEGAVYEWQISTTRRISETIIKSCQFADANMTSDGKSVFAVGSDGRIREIMNCNIHRDVLLTRSGLDRVVLSNSDMMLFASGNCGVVYSVKLPILDNAEYVEYIVHNKKITHMLITYDDKLLISCSEDGCICVWKLLNIEGIAVKLDKEFVPSTEILISRGDLEDKLAIIKDLQLRMHELETEHAYQMRQTEAMHNATIKDIHEGYCSAIEELKEKNEQLEGDHVQEINNINTEINKMKTNHEVFVQKLEANYNEKLIMEYDKYLQLEGKMERMRTRYEKELEDLHDAKKNSETTITNDFIQKLTDKEVQLEELIEESKQRDKEHETIKQQIEDDADREICEIKTTYEKQLTDEQDANVRLKGETQIIKKKLTAAQKDIDDLKHSVHTHENEHYKLKQIILGLEKDIIDLKKEIAERDATIQDKEKRIFELKRKNQELEKFKFILDFKINELKSQIEPRDRTIREQQEQITDMVKELENLQKIILSLDVQLTELREKLKAADREIKREITKNRAAKASLKTVRNDIHHASGLIQDIPKLQRAVRDMYHKYNADKDFEIIQAEDSEAKSEFLRQRDFLERTVRTLQGQLSKTSNTQMDKMTLIDENSILIAETNALRKDLKVELRKNQKMEALLGLHRTTSTKECEKKLNDAVATRQGIHNEYKDKLSDQKKRIEALQEETRRLLSKITGENSDEEGAQQETIND